MDFNKSMLYKKKRFNAFFLNSNIVGFSTIRYEISVSRVKKGVVVVTKEAADAMYMVIVVEEEVVVEMEEEAVAAKVNLRMVLVSANFVCSILMEKVRNHQNKLGTKK